MYVFIGSSGKEVPSRLLDGSSEHVLTYEDKEGDWMLVGDVPWGYGVTYSILRYLCFLSFVSAFLY